jgi:hypothetical protein
MVSTNMDVCIVLTEKVRAHYNVAPIFKTIDDA